MSRREKPNNIGQALGEVMAAEQDLLCAYERALALLEEGTPRHLAVEKLYSRAVHASGDTQGTLFSPEVGGSPGELLEILQSRAEAGGAPDPGEDPLTKPN